MALYYDYIGASSLPLDKITLSASSVSSPAFQLTLEFRYVELTRITTT